MTTIVAQKDSKNKKHAFQQDRESPQILFEKLVNTYYAQEPFTKYSKKNLELEVKFGTKGVKYLTKIDYDNVIRKLKSFGFTSNNEQGAYMLRIQNEFLDSVSGRFKESNIRTELLGLNSIQEYCKSNDVKKLLSDSQYNRCVSFVKKDAVFIKDDKVRDVNFNDFNFRISLKSEESLGVADKITRNIIENWEKTKKTLFRYINRVTFAHPDYPINADISIVKNSRKENDAFVKVYRTDESGVFTNIETYEIELEIDNSKIGPGTLFNSPEKIVQAIRKVIKFVLMGLQGTNFPISYTEQKMVLQSYMKMIYGDDFDPTDYKKGRIFNSNFIGPSSYTLQMQNVVSLDEHMIVPNIRNNYVVTDKADGDRHLLYISGNGKMYLINTNMNVIFTGAVTKEKAAFNTLIDGELVLHNKLGDFINLFAAFDIYYMQNNDIRSYSFIPATAEDNKAKSRYPLMKNVFRVLNAVSIIEGEISPMRFESKGFHPRNPSDNIFSACNYILTREKEGAYEYNTDGLIFTPAFLGVGSNSIGKAGPLKKVTWEYSLKWKPPKYNTIDFLVTTKKTANEEDIVTPIFSDGMDTTNISQLKQYKTIILRCGFSQRDHIYLNPCQDVLDDKLPEFSDAENENTYEPKRFYPTDPYDETAGICNIMLRKDDSDTNQMFTEEEQVFEDNTIVEFSYNPDAEPGWRWVPLRVRYDKTAELRQGGKNYGNAYNVANSNWKSIHNPVTEEMITTGAKIPDFIGDENVYYNRTTASTKTRALRDFHNLYVKLLLVTSVSKKGDTLIDYACGKGGDFSKWIKAQLSFVFGIDVHADNLENKIDGACARFLNLRKKFQNMPYALFVNGNSTANIRNGSAMMNDKAVEITKAIFGEGTKESDKIGKAVARQYGKGAEGFSISSCQFAIHYFFENQTTFQNFMRNVAECTKIGGYFIGTSYDGKLLFNKLKNKEIGDGVEIVEDGTKIWEIKKQYNSDNFEDDISCLGYRIDVFQESINKSFSEFLVNYDYLNRIMEDYGFKLVEREEARTMGLPEGSGLFSELFMNMQEEVKRNRSKEKDYGEALQMNAYEKKISFLNRYFVYKKIRNVNAAKVELESVEQTEADIASVLTKPAREPETKTKTKTTKEKKTKPKPESKPKIRKLDRTIVLEQTESQPESQPEKTKKGKEKKPLLLIEDDDDEEK
jgi:hypothetical protein